MKELKTLAWGAASIAIIYLNACLIVGGFLNIPIRIFF